MSNANISREEAAGRSRLVTTSAYRVTVDVTGRGVDDPTRQFRSITELDLDAVGGAIHLDLIADAVMSATLDGEPIDTTDFNGFRLLLPDLSEGAHTVVVDAVCRFSRTGEGLHRFVDQADDRVYLYSQFETADARRMFANLEQPDQKATFQLTVLAPLHWAVLSNSAGVSPEDLGDGVGRWTHTPTGRVSTYITALVAGEYHVDEGEIISAGRSIPARIACRQSVAQHLDADVIRTTTQRGFEVFEEAFATPYPFDSYDQIFVPEFNAGAMENAGCVTFRDEYLFRSRVTARELEARDNTILHELAHMWFGDLVTMRWWDDLWLNESFAEWASHFAADEIARRWGGDANPWASFSNERKAWAYLADQLSTTHPIAADMVDLDAVEQNFDGITYAKGASVLKLLVSFVGREAFLRGVAAYFARHAWGNTELADLLTQLELSSGRDLSWFTGEWLATAGVNTLRADFEIDDEGRFSRFDVLQTATAEHPTLRTHRLGIGIYSMRDGALVRAQYVEADIAGAATDIPGLVGVDSGDVVLLNDGDLTYAKVRFDEASAAALVRRIGELHDPLARAVVWSSFWDSVRDAELPPQRFIDLALAGLASERDMAAVTTIASQAAACATRFMASELRPEANHHLTAGLAQLLKGAAPGSDEQLIFAKTLIGVARSDAAIELIRGWLDGEEVPEGLAIDVGVRWAIVSTLAARGVIGHEEIDAELARDNTNAGAERAAGARASLPDAASKSEAWRLATADPDVPNETHRSICTGFWRYGQEDLLAPYVDAYKDVCAAINARTGLWAERGYATVGTVLRWLFPDVLADRDLVGEFSTWASENVTDEQVRRGLAERLDEARRALLVQDASRVTTQ